MPKTRKTTVKKTKLITSKNTVLTQLKRPVYKFGKHEILKNRQLEGELSEQKAQVEDEMKVIDESFPELNHTIDFEENDKLPLESIHFDPVVLYNNNIPFKDSSDSDLAKLCIQRLQIMLIEGDELEANIHFNNLMKANWSPVFDIIQNVLYQINDNTIMNRHNFRYAIIFLIFSIQNNNNTFIVHEVLRLAQHTVRIYFNLHGQKKDVLKRLFSVCLEKAAEKDNDIITFAEELYREHKEKNLLLMMVDLFLPLDGQISKKMYSYLSYKIYMSLLGKTMNTCPSDIKEWFVQDLVEKNYFKKKPREVLSSVVQLLEHVVFILDLYQEEKKVKDMYDFLNAAIKYSSYNLIEDSMQLINIIDQWRLRLFRLFAIRNAETYCNILKSVDDGCTEKVHFNSKTENDEEKDRYKNHVKHVKTVA